jgi:hypothetical protein
MNSKVHHIKNKESAYPLTTVIIILSPFLSLRGAAAVPAQAGKQSRCIAMGLHVSRFALNAGNITGLFMRFATALFAAYAAPTL